ncbi:imidazole glycerol phosphate synthase subunit HisH [Granulicella sibirica]|uniref:Imidazole glycerol phosphate synthase subunit HisH n=1 Tax=Granulicella sibirica TaxID=2479048 RepID=A0A4Q0SY00_9BACT|nr:imidazole glycerol phosphate synthase subunit HisH [Granulicella sibirica]RXH54860.1 Imidazole glycerol phosphate synthase amidotransferase subunit [Granulicella sibirica]
MIAVIDYKAGNLTSVVKTLTYLGAETEITQDPEVVRRASKIVLPGVGHFRATSLLNELHITKAVRESIARGAWFLGVCVGLQWLYQGSTEAPETPGLGHFAGECERFPALFEGEPLKAPHVGWNSLEDLKPDSKLMRGIQPGEFVYYTHSWRAPLSPDTAASTPYGGSFTGAVERDNVMGVQFHPEKSASVGLRVLQNFIDL